jgi:uncharacterized protein (TIGR02145 family)
VTIHATIEEKDATRTVMDENNNILWSENDQIIAFMKSSYGYKYQVKPAFVGKSYADFSMVSSGNGSDLSAGNEWEHNVVYYPYSEDIECLKSGANYELEVNLPSEQVYAPDSFANGSMAMVAVSESNNITFKNVLGGIKLQLRGTQKVTSIKVEGKNNEKLSGAAVVTAYTDNTKPAITMSSDASTSVILNCGSGVQLNESKATEFIITLPPVIFSKGFAVTVTDDTGETFILETDMANTVLRSSLLSMPVVSLDELEDEELIIPVVTVSLSYTSLVINMGESYQLVATVKPIDATDRTVVWGSDNPEVATVDQFGTITTISVGVANISAAAGGKVGICEVTVITPKGTDYIDEYGINHGKGITIGNTVWAPVNCGYHITDYKYGLLYQWGRRYGQGYDENDVSVPEIEAGGVSIITGQDESKANVFFTGTSEYNDDWLYPQDKTLWNLGTLENPVKTGYDPCPNGWRVPTYPELEELIKNKSSWTTDENGQSGYWFSGRTPFADDVPKVFFPAAGYHYFKDCSAYSRGYEGFYWSSYPYGSNATHLNFDRASVKINRFNVLDNRANGYSVRCVQE